MTDPSPLRPLPAQPDGVPWPTQEWPTADAAVADPGELERLLAIPFADPTPTELGHTNALLVVHRGELVVERYGERFVTELEELGGVQPGPILPTTPLLSWSMAKSVLHLVVGLLAEDGLVGVDDPAPVPAWSDPDDPRHAITWDQLLQMRPGLAWTEEYYDFDSEKLPDVVTMLYGDERHDVAGFASGFPLVDTPGSPEAYNYSSGTSNIVAAAAARVIGGGEEAMRDFLTSRLAWPLGLSSFDPTFDAMGTFVASSFLHMTARDWARVGLFALRDGVWEDQRLLPEGWIDHGRLPRSPDDNFDYGAHWWTMKDGRWGAFLAVGFEGQRIYAVPDLDLVLVRLGRTHTDHRVTMDDHLQQVIAQFE